MLWSGILWELLRSYPTTHPSYLPSPALFARSTTDPISDPHSFHVRWVYRKYLFFGEKRGSLWIRCSLVCSFSISGIILSINSMLTGGSTLDPQCFTSWCLRSHLLVHSPGQGQTIKEGRESHDSRCEVGYDNSEKRLPLKSEYKQRQWRCGEIRTPAGALLNVETSMVASKKNIYFPYDSVISLWAHIQEK